MEAAIDEGVVDDLVRGEGDLVVVLGVDVAVDPRHLVHEEVHEEEEEVVGPQAGTYSQDELRMKIYKVFIYPHTILLRANDTL